DYATAVSAPILGVDTVRYQTLLLTLSLLFVSMRFFRFNTVKIFDALVVVDRPLLVIYATFIAAVALLFLIKAYVDYKRAKLTRKKNAEVAYEVPYLIRMRMLRKQFQNYFWTELSNALARAYFVSLDDLADARNEKRDEHLDLVQF